MSRIRFSAAKRRLHGHRDDAGVPHVTAATFEDALYALGYLHALDRPTQMLFARTVARGEAAEQIADKKSLLETDRFFRKAALFRNLDREYRRLPQRTQRQLDTYCAGVNDGLKQAGRSLPMWATGFRPLPWTPQSVLLIGNLLSYGGLAVGQSQNERIVLELIQLGIDEQRLKDLFSPQLDSADFELIRDVRLSNQLSNEALELITDLPRLAGSNAWAVSPQRSATQHALLASDPHLEINRLPAIWYEACLKWDRGYVLGASLPGCPLFAVARTAKLAWGVTYMKGDTSDFFIEDCRPGGATGWQYRRGPAWHDFQLREETIHQKGNGSESLRVYENDQGTLETDPNEFGRGCYLSLAWTGYREGAGHSMATWIDMLSARDTLHGMEIARECPHPTLVWIFADSQGHIGKQACGSFPERGRDSNGLVAVPAWNARNHWRGLVPTEMLPREYDPPCGYVASANEDINPPDGKQLISLILPDYRARRIVERLAALPQATVQDFQALQYDVVSLQARDLLKVFLPHLADGPLKTALLEWDCGYGADQVEPTLFLWLYRNVLLEIFGHEKGIGWRRMLYLCTRAGYSTMVLTAIDQLIQRDASLWWSDASKGDWIRRAADRVEAIMVQAEPWSATNAFHFTNRFFDGRLAGRFLGFRTAAMGMPGCHATPFQGHVLRTAAHESTFAPSYHFVTDMGTQEAWTNLPGGPSESRFSRYYQADLDRWQRGEYKRLSPGEADA